VEKLKPLHIDGENVNGAATVQKSLAAPQRAKHRITICPVIPHPGM
jgi:hypothetical protein